MRFGVIICPQCNQTRGVDLASKITKCIRCGKPLPIKKMKIFYETDSQEKLREVIGLINVKLDRKYDSFKKSSNDKNKLKQKHFK